MLARWEASRRITDKLTVNEMESRSLQYDFWKASCAQ